MVTTMFLGMERTAQFEVDAEARMRTRGFDQHRQKPHAAWLNALVTPVLRGSLVASVTF